jgi:hypothetical protein
MNATLIDIATALESLDPLLVRRVRHLLRGRRADQMDDATQAVRLMLWRGSPSTTRPATRSSHPPGA